MTVTAVADPTLYVRTMCSRHSVPTAPRARIFRKVKSTRLTRIAIVTTIGLMSLARLADAAEFKLNHAGSVRGGLIDERIWIETASGERDIRSGDITSFSIGSPIRIFQDVVTGDVTVAIPQRPLVFRGVRMTDGKVHLGQLKRSVVTVQPGTGVRTFALSELDAYIPDGQAASIKVLPTAPFTLQRSLVKQGLQMWSRKEDASADEQGILGPLFRALSNETHRTLEVTVE